MEDRLRELDGEIADVGGRQHDLARRQQALEDEVARLGAKIQEVDRTLYGGTVTAPRELQALQADQESLARHRSELEDQVLELMEAREPVEADLGRLEQERASAEADVERLRAAIGAAETVIDAELAVEEEQRGAARRDVPADLLERYESLRTRLGGVGAARLVGGSCDGCHLKLSATEFDHIKHAPPDEVITCESCGRILVR